MHQPVTPSTTNAIKHLYLAENPTAMITGEIRSKIDRVWESFWTGGLSNPITVIEQMTYLLFIRRLDDLHTQREQKAAFLKRPIEHPIYRPDQDELRWRFFKNYDPDVMFELFRKPGGVFDFMKSYGEEDSAFSRFMKGATFMIPTPRLLAQVVDMLDNIDMADRDTKGDVYEYLLSKIASAGTNGQFRTPRHIIKMMVEMVAPTVEDVICDPAAGSSGFLVYSGEYIREKYGNELLKPAVQRHFQDTMFMGMEFDPSMLRISAMNLILHGIENPHLRDVDALSEDNRDFTEQASIILANPPFKGSLDKEAVDPAILSVVNSTKTELLFLALILKGLKVGGRAAVIVPDGVLFGSSKAHQQIRKEIIDNHKLQGVVSMPSGVFKPYAGVSTAVLFFTKTCSGGTDQVWFYDMHSDGYSLDDRRTPQPDKSNIGDIVSRWKALDKETGRKRTDKSFMVPVDEIRSNGYDLSINRYKEVVYEQKQYEKPEVIIAQIEQLDEERRELLAELKSMLLEGEETLSLAAEDSVDYKTTGR
jgi:type I restriction enzyme M protein